MWQTKWRILVVMPARQYKATTGKVGGLFVQSLTNNLRGVRACRWNTKWFIVFLMVILYHATQITAPHTIWRRIGKHLDAWEASHNQMLVAEIVCTCKQCLSKALWD